MQHQKPLGAFTFFYLYLLAALGSTICPRRCCSFVLYLRRKEQFPCRQVFAAACGWCRASWSCSVCCHRLLTRSLESLAAQQPFDMTGPALCVRSAGHSPFLMELLTCLHWLPSYTHPNTSAAAPCVCVCACVRACVYVKDAQRMHEPLFLHLYICNSSVCLTGLFSPLKCINHH